MKAIIAFLALLSAADAAGSLRGEAEPRGPPIACLVKGGTSQSQCDATTSEDGSTCVWCSLSSYGACVDESIATQMKQMLPALQCDNEDDDDDDDDNAPAADDDKAPEGDDSVPDDDDKFPDRYWECREKYGKKAACTAAGCAWCDNKGKGGYGICVDTETADGYDDHSVYSCTMPSALGFGSIPAEEAPANTSDPGDFACILSAATDQASCEKTSAADGQPCEWCSLQGVPLCVSSDQARIAQTVGATCGEGDRAVLDPYDPTCLAVTLQGDESACRATVDVDGDACEWCSLQGYEFCADADQAELAEQVGASCSDRESAAGESVGATALTDPSDPTCLFVTLEGDEDACKQTMDAENKPCQWCTVQGYDFCMNSDQADLAEQVGATCSDGSGEQRAEQEAGLSDPNDPTCLFVTLEGDEDACKQTKDADNKPCEWCSLQGYDFCMNSDQADFAEQVGASCSKERGADQTEGLSDPNDPSCLLATLQGDEEACKQTMDATNKPCEWCSLAGYGFCANVDQAQIADQAGATCDGVAPGISAATA